MRTTQCLFAAVLTLGISGSAMAQGAATPTNTSSTVGHWTASGLIGGNFNTGSSATLIGAGGNSVGVDFANGGGVEYGAAISYQWRNILGAEFLGSWSPSFDVTSVALGLDRSPHLDTYMANVIALVPIGERVQPYISGGIGAISLSADVLTLNGALVTSAGTIANVETTRASRTDFGQDFGGGVMAFVSDRVGFRGDLRYYHAGTDNTRSTIIQDQLIRGALSGIHVWRADAGVTLRW